MEQNDFEEPTLSPEVEHILAHPVLQVRKNSPCPCGSGRKAKACHAELINTAAPAVKREITLPKAYHLRRGETVEEFKQRIAREGEAAARREGRL